MSYNSRLQENNAELQDILDTVNALAEAGTGDTEPAIEALAVTENGTYEAPEGVDGFSPVTVSVDDRYDEGYSEGYSEGYNASQGSITLQEKTATANGEVTPDAGYTGLSKVTVAVPTAAQAVPVIDVDTNGLITATATQVGGYVDDGVETATQQLPTIGAMTITPTEFEQVAVSAGTFVTGSIKVAAVDAVGGTVETWTFTMEDGTEIEKQVVIA